MQQLFVTKPQDVLQKRLPNLAISPSCCVMYMKNSESQEALFKSCEYANKLWLKIHASFDWETDIDEKINILLHAFLADHPFIKEKEILWVQLIRAFLGVSLEGRNNKIFNNRSLPFEIFLEPVVDDVIGWCKCLYHPFTNFRLDDLLINWRASYNRQLLGYSPFCMSSYQ